MLEIMMVVGSGVILFIIYSDFTWVCSDFRNSCINLYFCERKWNVWSCGLQL